MPKKVAAIPKITLKDTYTAKYICWVSRSNIKLSRVKVEKVVNPPQNPVVRNSLTSGEKTFDFSDIP